VLESVEKDKVTWDKAARKLVGSIVKELYQEVFPEYNVRENVKSISRYLSGEIERAILDFYETKLNTKVYLFELFSKVL